VTFGKLAPLNQLLDFVRQLQETEQIGDRGSVPPDETSNLRLGELKFFAQALIPGCLIDRREIISLQVLDKSERQQGLVINILYYRWDLGPPQSLNGPPATFSRNQLVPPIARTNNHRLEKAGCFDGGRKLHEFGFVYLGSGLERIGQYAADWEFSKRSSGLGLFVRDRAEQGLQSTT
jgi:hypothetical protein